jgi:hypothetical protein
VTGTPVLDPSGLLVHQPTGWLVDPDTGNVYTTNGSWAGKRVGTPNAKGHLRANRRQRDGSTRSWQLKQVMWEAVNGVALPEAHALDCIDGDGGNVAYSNLRLVPARRHAYGAENLQPEAADRLPVHGPTGWRVDVEAGAVYSGSANQRWRRLRALTPDGAPVGVVDGRSWMLARVVWEVATGTPPAEGMAVMPVNGDRTDISHANLHLIPKDEARGVRKLSDDQVRAIRSSRDRVSARELAVRYGVGADYVHRLWRGDNRGTTS